MAPVLPSQAGDTWSEALQQGSGQAEWTSVTSFLMGGENGARQTWA